MEKKNKACWNCANYGAYYKRGCSSFIKTNEGSCSVKREVVNKKGYCDCWRNTFALKSRRKKNVLLALNEVLIDLKAIRQILEEQDEESKTHPHHVDL